jgi:hypothetical protein
MSRTSPPRHGNEQLLATNGDQQHGHRIRRAAVRPAHVPLASDALHPHQHPAQALPNASFVAQVKVGALPYNAFLVGGHFQVYTTFSGGGVTALTASLGTNSDGGSANIVNAQSLLTAGAAGSLTLVNPGATATGNGLIANGANGGFDLWLTLSATTGYPTSGNAMMSLEYLAPNDSGATRVPIGGSAPGC